MKRINFLILHGTMGSPEGNWFPWLKAELEKDGHGVNAPLFPTPEGQDFLSWSALAQKQMERLDPAATILVGHSIGAIFALGLVQEIRKSFRAAFLICPFMRKIGLEPYDGLNASFIDRAFDWPLLRKSIGETHCFMGSDDPYVPLAMSREIADNMHTDLTVVEKGGHLNAEAGYREFPLLRDKIRQTVGV